MAIVHMVAYSELTIGAGYCVIRTLSTLDEMTAALSGQFKHMVVTWNSGNFYGLAASNCAKNLNRFVAAMPTPAIPREYLYACLSQDFAAL